MISIKYLDHNIVLDNILMGPLSSLFSANHSEHFIGNSSARAASYRHSWVIMRAFFSMSTKSKHVIHKTSGSKRGSIAWRCGVLRMAASFTAFSFFFSNWFCQPSSWFSPTLEFIRSSSPPSSSSDAGDGVHLNLRADYPGWPLRLLSAGGELTAVAIHVDCHVQLGSFLMVNYTFDEANYIKLDKQTKEKTYKRKPKKVNEGQLTCFYKSQVDLSEKITYKNLSIMNEWMNLSEVHLVKLKGKNYNWTPLKDSYTKA